MARTNKFITQPTDDQMAGYPKEVRELIKKGKTQGFVTHQELLKAMPNIEKDFILLDEIYTLFMDLGIEVLDTKDSIVLNEKDWEDDDLSKKTLVEDDIPEEEGERLTTAARKEKRKKKELEFREIANDSIRPLKAAVKRAVVTTAA